MTLRHTARRRTTGRVAIEAMPRAAPVLVPASVTRLLGLADAELAQAAATADPDERFRHAHLAALRCAAAVVELRGRPGPRSGARTVWAMLTLVEPALASWSGYFAAGARLRAALDAGRPDVVDAVRAGELVACAEDFRDEVAMLIDPDAEFSRPMHWAAAVS